MTGATAPAVRLSGLRFRWRRGAPLVLDIPELAVARGERLFLNGPSGSGKSTLLNLLGGIMAPEDGEVRILGTDLAALSGAGRDAFRADHIGFIFQMFNLVPYLSLVDNVLLPCRFSGRRRAAAEAASGSGGGLEGEAMRLLDHVGLAEAARSGRPVSDLSVGQQQRVAAARALIGAPALVIADEPTSSLDANAQQAFLDLLFREASANGATLLFVSHDQRLAASFDRSLRLSDINKAGLEDAA